MNKYLINFLIFFGLCFYAKANLSRHDIDNLPESVIIKASGELINLYNSAEDEVKKTKADLAEVQKKYNDSELNLKHAEEDRDKYKLAAVSAAKQRDVVVICFAILFSMWFGGFLGKFLYLAPPPWDFFAPLAGYGLGLILGYGLGRYILLWLSGLIP